MLNSETEQIRIGHQLAVLDSIEGTVAANVTSLLPVEEAWQPTDYLPDLTAENWIEQLQAFRDPSMQLSDELLVVLVGDMVTEEALPNYAISLNLLARDQSGTADSPWARWMRGWTSEENRHGDLLNAYLRLTGRVNMRAVELTVHNLIANGFNPKSFPDPYAGLIYTAFQERATKLSHARVGRLASRAGEQTLMRICGKISGDEGRHERFYTNVMAAVMAADPERGVLVFHDLMRRIISMPGKLMCDGKDPDLFDHFATVAQRIGVYTMHDYADIVRHLVATWKVAELQLSAQAAKAQESLCRQAERLNSLADMVSERIKEAPAVKFSWIHDRLA